MAVAGPRMWAEHNMQMKKNPILFLAGLAGAGLVASALYASAELGPDEARAKLQAGAKLVDVRTVQEFREKNLPGAVNIPVDQIKTGITNVTTNKSQVILLHCRSGRRSGIAETELRALGYTNAFNIGSCGQAEKIVRSAKP